MTNYLDLAHTLLEQSSTLSSENYFLSIYFPFEANPDRSGELRTKFKGVLQEAIGEFEPLSEFKIERTKLVDDFFAISENFDYAKSGFAMFCKFSIEPGSKGNWNYKLNENVWFTNLHTPVTKQIYVGYTFDLDQLLTNIYADTTTTILDLKQHEARIFSLRQSEWKQIAVVTNERIEIDESQTEIMNQSSGKPSLGNSLNTGENNDWLIEEERHFLTDVTDKMHQLKLNPDYLLVFYSTNFSKILHDTKERIPNGYKLKFETQFLEKNLKRESEIKAEALKEVWELDLKCKQKKLSQAKADYKLFVNSLDKVVSATNDGKIETLFLKPNLSLPGWVENISHDAETESAAMQILHLSQQPNSLKAANILPWIVKKTISLGGSVLVLNEESGFENETDISAKLRFA